MATIWFNHGYASIRDALIMIREGAGQAGVPVWPVPSGIRLIASHRDSQAAVLDVADLAIAEPCFDRNSAAGEKALVDWCLSVCREHGVDLFVPQSGRALIAARTAEFEAIGTRVSVPAGADMLKLIDDKSAFYAVALEHGLPMPWTREVFDPESFDAAVATLESAGLEACVKPPEGVFGAGFWRMNAQGGLFETLMNPDAHETTQGVIRDALAKAPAGTRLLVLEYLAGVEWSIDCVCSDGRLVLGVARRKAGRAQRLETSGPVFDIAHAAVAAFGLSGLINVQCRAAAPDGSDPRLLEINSRMSGGCAYTRYSGVNLPWWHVALELGLVAADTPPAPAGGALVAAFTEAMLIADRGPGPGLGDVAYE